MRSQARRRSLRIPLWTLQLAGLLVSAALTVAVLVFVLSWFLGLAEYIPSQLP